ncbi:MAG TPA: hypothetical protein VH969_19780 [Actinophytocola sp.]|uniref:hypothetical protein n=1 Tax=Actinophytocola sp. TaxID=1872138 RepID=UPI002F921590
MALDGLGTWLFARLTAMSPADPYRPPSPAERDAGTAGLRALLRGERAPELPGLGFGVSAIADGRPYTLVAGESGTERAWGTVVLDTSGPPRRVIAVPHPIADRLTAWLGYQLFRAMPGSALLLAGTHRRAGGGAADVAHRTDSMFHAFAGVLAEHAPAELQPHGYAAATLPGYDAVVAAGAATVCGAHVALRDALVARGFRVRPEWTGLLDGATNVQSAAAAARGSAFLHLELAPGPRVDPKARAVVVTAVAETWRDV